ncbi:hypothetical protein BD309DRAFT_60211 [Dichomitus squalens]|nr:hypothetical protein BD309DRAFT_60211 [Dichomitus squalens]
MSGFCGRGTSVEPPSQRRGVVQARHSTNPPSEAVEYAIARFYCTAVLRYRTYTMGCQTPRSPNTRSVDFVTYLILRMYMVAIYYNLGTIHIASLQHDFFMLSARK